jgi:hypothetical protein
VNPLHGSVLASTEQHPDKAVPTTERYDDRHLTECDETGSKVVDSGWVLDLVEREAGAEEDGEEDHEDVDESEDDTGRGDVREEPRERSVKEDTVSEWDVRSQRGYVRWWRRRGPTFRRIGAGVDETTPTVR